MEILNLRGNDESIELGIQHYQNALQVLNPTAFPREWALAHVRLGSAYRSRSKGEKDENVDQSIQHFENAFQVFKKISSPEDWAFINMHLGLSYQEKSENIEKAIQHWRKALEVFDEDSFPFEFAEIQMNLSLNYKDRIQGNAIANQGRALKHYLLSIRAKSTFPTPYYHPYNKTEIEARRKGEKEIKYRTMKS